MKNFSLAIIGALTISSAAQANTQTIMDCEATIAKTSIYDREPVYRFVVESDRGEYRLEAFRYNAQGQEIFIGAVDSLSNTSISRSDDGVVDSVGISFALSNLKVFTRDISFSVGSNFNGSVQRGDALGTDITFNGQFFPTTIGLYPNSIKAGDRSTRCEYLQIRD